MPDALTWIGSGLVALGAVATLLGAIGLLRFPDFYARTHAAAITDTIGATLVILGLGLLSDSWVTALKLSLVWVFLVITTPTAAHALADAAHSAGLKPIVGGFRINVSAKPDDKEEPL